MTLSGHQATSQEQTGTNVSSSMVNNCDSSASSDIRQNKYVSKTLQYFVSVLEYLGFVGPWVSAVLSLVFHWGLAVVRTLSNPLSVGPDFSGHLTIL